MADGVHRPQRGRLLPADSLLGRLEYPPVQEQDDGQRQVKRGQCRKHLTQNTKIVNLLSTALEPKSMKKEGPTNQENF